MTQDLDRLLDLAREAADGNAFVAKRAVTSVMHRHRERVDREFKEACTPQAIIGLIERVKEAEESAEVDGEYARWASKRVETLEARLRAAEEVVETARILHTSDAMTVGEHRDAFNALTEALRHYDEAVGRVKE